MTYGKYMGNKWEIWNMRGKYMGNVVMYGTYVGNMVIYRKYNLVNVYMTGLWWSLPL